MKSTTIIIPIYNLTDNRLRNFNFVLRNVRNLICNIIVCEQFSENLVRNSIKQPNINHIITHTPTSDTIYKSHLVNHAVSTCNSDYIWMMDADFFTNYSGVLDYINTHDYKFVRPFESVVFMNNDDSEQLISSGGVLLTGNHDTNNQTGKFSFLVNRELFISVGGMDENFRGWGFQDLDFVDNRISTKTKVGVVNQLGYHLYHERPPKTHADSNYKLYSKNRYHIKQQYKLDSTIEYVGKNFT